MPNHTKSALPDDILPDQIVEDDDGNMRVISDEMLLRNNENGEDLLRENELALENLENDAPCTDVSRDITDFESL